MRSPFIPVMISRSVRPREYIPTSQAATKPSAPMLIGNTVPTTNSATSARIETKTGDMCGPWVQGRQWPVGALTASGGGLVWWLIGLATSSVHHVSIDCGHVRWSKPPAGLATAPVRAGHEPDPVVDRRERPRGRRPVAAGAGARHT